MLRVLFVPGVAPGRWERTWAERMRRERLEPLELRPAEQDAALASVVDGTADLAFLRDIARGVHGGAELHAIPLYRETPVVVAAREHPLALFDEVSPADLAGETLIEGADAAAVAIAATGAGVAILPGPVARDASRRDVIARPLVDTPDTGISLVWRTDRDSPAVQAFIGVVRGRTANSSR